MLSQNIFSDGMWPSHVILSALIAKVSFCNQLSQKLLIVTSKCHHKKIKYLLTKILIMRRIKETKYFLQRQLVVAIGVICNNILFTAKGIICNKDLVVTTNY